MKKLLLASATIASLMLASCSNEEVVAPATGGNVTFTAELPVLGSRAYGDGTTASSLTAYVYSAEEGQAPKFLFSKEADFKGKLQTTVTLDLVTGKTYDIVFWTQATEAPYTYDSDNRTITVTYGGAANDEKRDAFFFTEKGLKITGPVQKTVSLKRPFAQLNVLTSDYATAQASKIEVKQTGLTMTLPNTLDLTTGAVSGEAEVSYALADIPNDEIVKEESGKTYKYLSMNYILVGADKAIVDVKIGTDFALNSALTFNAVPVQRNYRTNIYGALLTNPAIFDVEILPDFDDMNNVEIAVWDGKSVAQPTINEDAKTVEVKGPAQFIGLAQLVNGTDGNPAQDFEGYTVTLDGDIDFGGNEITAIAADAVRDGGSYTGSVFKGVLDGNNATISNFTIANNTTNLDAVAGFIANLSGETAEVKNLKFKNIAISGPECEQVGVIGMVTGGAKVTNVHVQSGTVNGRQGVGGIVGRMMKDGSIENCSNAAEISCTTNNVGGIVGAAYRTEVGKTMTIKDCHNTGKIYAKNVSAGGIAGLNAADITNCTNDGEISGDNNSIGGIAGQQIARGTLSGCTNNGKVSGNGGLGYGGIIGWLVYNSIPSAYPNYGIVSITACTNNGQIIAPNASSAAGIVGLTYRHATITDCNNTSSRITAKDMAAGITVYQNTGNALPDTEGHLTVTGCTSTTNTETQMTAGLKGEIVYDNTAGANTTIENNTYAPAE